MSSGLRAGAGILVAMGAWSLWAGCDPECESIADCPLCHSCVARRCRRLALDCHDDTQCQAGSVCEYFCCKNGCRDDGDCGGATQRCVTRAGDAVGQCRPACTPDLDLDGKTFEYVYNCTRGFSSGVMPTVCSESLATSRITFTKTATNADASVSYRLQGSSEHPARAGPGCCAPP